MIMKSKPPHPKLPPDLTESWYDRNRELAERRKQLSITLQQKEASGKVRSGKKHGEEGRFYIIFCRRDFF